MTESELATQKAFTRIEGKLGKIESSTDRTEKALFGNGQVGMAVGLAVTLFVVMDCVMSAIGSAANDAAFSAWVIAAFASCTCLL